MKFTSIPEKQAREIGLQIVAMLNLKAKDGKYATSWGTKTLEGLGRCASRIVEEAAPVTDVLENQI